MLLLSNGGEIIQYDKTFKEERVCLSDEIGLENAAPQLDISYYDLSGWRNKYEQRAFLEKRFKIVLAVLRENVDESTDCISSTKDLSMQQPRFRKKILLRKMEY